MEAKRLIAAEWFNYAQQDFTSAQYLAEMPTSPMENICFLCQQAAEKALKGYLILNDVPEPPLTHDLGWLSKMCVEKDPNFEQIEESSINLTPYGVRARYPFQIDITRKDMFRALKDADKVIGFVLDRVKGKRQGYRIKPQKKTLARSKSDFLSAERTTSGDRKIEKYVPQL